MKKLLFCIKHELNIYFRTKATAHLLEQDLSYKFYMSLVSLTDE